MSDIPANSTRPHRWTVKDVLQWTAEYFKSKGISSPRLDAEVLLAFALSVDRLHLYLNLERPLSPDERLRYRELVRRRAQREPVALIVGRKEFWSISLRTARGVLVPRPETEILVEAVLDAIRGLPAPFVLEIGTGSGAVAAATAHEHRGASVVATDVDPQALCTAALNAREAGVAASVLFVSSDLFSAIKPGKQFDVVCSNPPYIPTGSIAGLEPEITGFEPLLALDGGPDGLDVVRRIAVQSPDYLKEGGALILEVGEGQADAVIDLLLHQVGFRQTGTFRDLAGKQRVVLGRL